MGWLFSYVVSVKARNRCRSARLARLDFGWMHCRKHGKLGMRMSNTHFWGAIFLVKADNWYRTELRIWILIIVVVFLFESCHIALLHWQVPILCAGSLWSKLPCMLRHCLLLDISQLFKLNTPCWAATYFQFLPSGLYPPPRIQTQ